MRVIKHLVKSDIFGFMLNHTITFLKMNLIILLHPCFATQKKGITVLYCIPLVTMYIVQCTYSTVVLNVGGGGWPEKANLR